MKLRNEQTGDLLEWPPPLPDADGWIVVTINGQPVVKIQCLDGLMLNRLEDGTLLTADETATYIFELLNREPRLRDRQ